MRALTRLAFMTMALICGIGSAGAQFGSGGAPSPLDLTPQQRTTIYQSVTSQKDKVRTPPPADLPLSVGAQIPASTELYSWPDNVAADVPGAKLYRYTVAQNQVVIVDPTTMRIVEIVRQ